MKGISTLRTFTAKPAETLPSGANRGIAATTAKGPARFYWRLLFSAGDLDPPS